MYFNQAFSTVIFIVLLTASLWLQSPGIALSFGLLFGLTCTCAFTKILKSSRQFFLQASIVGLGFGMDFHNVIAVGQAGFIYTLVSIGLTLLIGWWLGKQFKVQKHTSFLVSSGTAICGGSAIAAVSPMIKAKETEISLALAIVFTLNAIALVLFPWLGKLLALSQQQFAVWAAIAIHDTSSVVGAASAYGEEALNIATTIKLVRALWIVPLVIVIAIVVKPKGTRIQFPLFILLFLAASALNSFVPVVAEVAPSLYSAARVILVGVLFLVGCSLNRKTLRDIGFPAMWQGIALWGMVTVVSLVWVKVWL